jgi:hypothetical protein
MQARLYQESVRSMAELRDATGVELASGAGAARHRAMVVIKGEKLERARTYRRIMQACRRPDVTLLPNAS